MPLRGSITFCWGTIMTTFIEPPVPGEAFHTSVIEKLVGELYADQPRQLAGTVPGTGDAVPSSIASAQPGAAYPPPHKPTVGAHALTLPSTASTADGSLPIGRTPTALPGAVPALALPADWSTDYRGRPSSAALPAFPGLFGTDPARAASAAPPVHPAAPPPLESGTSGREPSSLDDALNPRDTFLFGEQRFHTSDTKVPAGASPVAIHHQRLDSSEQYYFLKKPAGEGKPGATQDTASRAIELRSQPAARQASTAGASAGLSAFDVQAIRRDFPALHQTVNGKPLVWLDNAATTHKAQSVIDITSEYYSRHNSNIHRAAHTLAARSTDLFEGARDKLRDFIGAASSREIVFVRGTTEGINLVANSYGQQHIGAGDEIIVTEIEHHANIVPWQLLAQRTGAVLRVAPVNDRGELILERFAALLGPRTKFVSITHVANALGTINPIEQIIALAHARGVPVLVDAAQSSPHIPLDVRALDADFLVLSGHKVFGPTGIGILYGKEHLLEALPPWQGGGHMIKDVTFAKTIFNGIPEKFEAGTPDIAGAVGLGAAVDYLTRIGLPAIAAYEHTLLEYATEALLDVRGVTLIGTAAAKASVLSFVVAGYEPEQVSRHLDKHGIATRSGHHCAQPALRHFGVETTVRASLAFYNSREDVNAFISALHLLRQR